MHETRDLELVSVAADKQRVPSCRGQSAWESLVAALVAIPSVPGSARHATGGSVTSGGTTTRGVFSKDAAWTERMVKAIGQAIAAK